MIMRGVTERTLDPESVEVLSYACHAGLASGSQQGKWAGCLLLLECDEAGELVFGPDERLVSLACIILS